MPRLLIALFLDLTFMPVSSLRLFSRDGSRISAGPGISNFLAIFAQNRKDLCSAPAYQTGGDNFWQLVTADAALINHKRIIDIDVAVGKLRRLPSNRLPT